MAAAGSRSGTGPASSGSTQPRPVVRPPQRTPTATDRRARLVWSNLMKVLALIALVIGAGALAGMAFGYPLKTLDLGGKPPIALDQEALAGTIDPELAVLTLADLPKGFTTNPEDDGSGVKLIGAPVCGKAVVPDSPVGDHLARTFLHPGNQWFMFSEVQRVRRTQDAGKFIREVAANFDECPGGKFFKVDGDSRTEFAILDDRPDPPVVDYVSRTLSPIGGGAVQIATYFQVGTVLVAMQYVGPANPPKSLLSDAEMEILYRVAPDQVSKTTKVNGAKPLPNEASTTTLVDFGQPSPTSSPPPPPTVATTAPPPTFEPTTTIKKKPVKKPAATTVPPATDPAPAIPGQ